MSTTTIIHTGTGTRTAPTSLDALQLDPTTSDLIPIIDLAGLADPSLRPVLAEALRKACTDVGFFYIKNHGVPESLIARQFDEARRFFGLPLELKEKIAVTPTTTGYVPLLGEQVDPDSRGDLHEAFDFGTRGHGTLDQEDGTLNRWPDEDEYGLATDVGTGGFKKGWIEYWDAMHDVAMSLFPLFALALGMEEGYFDDKLKHPSGLCRPLYYPPQEGVIDPTCLGIGAHHDYELVTILAQGDVQALQVLDSQDRWISAPVIPGTLVCNIGDQMNRWTNGVFKSTLHRAINRSGKPRYSIPYFFGADYDTLMVPIPTCVTAANPQKYEPILAGEYLAQRLQETYLGMKDPDTANK